MGKFFTGLAKAFHPGCWAGFCLRLVRRRVFWRWLFVFLLPFLLLTAFLLAIERLGRWTKSEILDASRFQALIHEIDCETPPGLSKKAFVAEVFALTPLGNSLPILATETKTRIQNAFANHPAVESVEGLKIFPGPRITVDLRFRIPVLAIKIPGNRLIIDGNCYLLPSYLDNQSLPLYISPVSNNKGIPGTVWNDAGLSEAAQLMAYLASDQEIFQINSIQHYVDGLVLGTKSSAIIHWGRPTKNLANAKAKRDRLHNLFRDGTRRHSLNAVYDLRILDQS